MRSSPEFTCNKWGWMAFQHILYAYTSELSEKKNHKDYPNGTVEFFASICFVPKHLLLKADKTLIDFRCFSMNKVPTLLKNIYKKYLEKSPLCREKQQQGQDNYISSLLS